MNIFYLNPSPELAAKDLCNKHVVKMGLEATQILNTLFPPHVAPMKATHVNHPCCIWARHSSSNFEWLLQHAKAIFDEYFRRYGRVHATEQSLASIKQLYNGMEYPHRQFQTHLFTEPPQCVLPQYKTPNTVDSYRQYYIGEKARFAKWMKLEEIPDWWPNRTLDFVRR